MSGSAGGFVARFERVMRSATGPAAAGALRDRVGDTARDASASVRKDARSHGQKQCSGGGGVRIVGAGESRDAATGGSASAGRTSRHLIPLRLGGASDFVVRAVSKADAAIFRALAHAVALQHPPA